MGCSSLASPAPLRQPERQTGLAFCQRFKSPKAASNLQFERPWDRLVPAKSVRKLTARTVVSKKFLDISCLSRTPVHCTILTRMIGAEEIKSAEDG